METLPSYRRCCFVVVKMARYENIVGNKYGKLLVVDEVEKVINGRKRYYVECVCDCGSRVLCEKSKVKGWQTRSCGCMQREMRKTLGSRTMKKPRGEASFNECYAAYKKSAKIRGYEFNLSKDEFREIVTKPCIYCGEALTQEKKKKGCNGTFKYTGIDRYDNSKGYVKGNCVPCCQKCNRIKGVMSADEMDKRLSTIISRRDMWKRTA